MTTHTPLVHNRNLRVLPSLRDSIVIATLFLHYSTSVVYLMIHSCEYLCALHTLALVPAQHLRLRLFGGAALPRLPAREPARPLWSLGLLQMCCLHPSRGVPFAQTMTLAESLVHAYCGRHFAFARLSGEQT